MSADLLQVLEAEIAKRETEIAAMRQTLAVLRPTSSPRPVANHRPARQAARANQPPPLREIAADIVRSRPGLVRADLMEALLAADVTDSSDPRKLLSTRIGQFVKAGHLVQDGDRLFVPGDTR